MNMYLRKIYLEEKTIVQQFALYADEEKDFEEIMRMDVIDRGDAAHLTNVSEVKNLLTHHALRSGDDFFHAAYILAHDDSLENKALACMLARIAKERAFTGLDSTHDIDGFIERADYSFRKNSIKISRH